MYLLGNLVRLMEPFIKPSSHLALLMFLVIVLTFIDVQNVINKIKSKKWFNQSETHQDLSLIVVKPNMSNAKIQHYKLKNKTCNKSFSYMIELILLSLAPVGEFDPSVMLSAINNLSMDISCHFYLHTYTSFQSV